MCSPKLPSQENFPSREFPPASSVPDAIISIAKPFRQKGRKFMSKRSGQSGQVFLRNGRWVGRYYVDVPGQTNRVRKAVVLGMKKRTDKTGGTNQADGNAFRGRRQHARAFRAVVAPAENLQRHCRFVGVEAAPSAKGKQSVFVPKTHCEAPSSVFRIDGAGRNQDRRRERLDHGAHEGALGTEDDPQYVETLSFDYELALSTKRRTASKVVSESSHDSRGRAKMVYTSRGPASSRGGRWSVQIAVSSCRV